MLKWKDVYQENKWKKSSVHACDRGNRVSRESTDLEYWTVEDLELQKTYYLKGDLQNTIDPSVADCGVVYVQGDVRSDVQIYTNEQ